MLKWKVMAVAGLCFGMVGTAWGLAQRRTAPGFYELRIYTAQPGSRDALAERFASRTADIYSRHGITNVGYWIPQQSDEDLGIDEATIRSSTSGAIRRRPSADRRLTAAHDDPEFTEVVRRQERDPERRLIVRAHNIDMVPSGPRSAITITP